MKAVPSAPEASTTLQERASAPAAPAPRIAAAPLRAKAAARERIAARVPSHPAIDEARAGMEIGVRMMVGSSADLAYLNGEAATPPEAPGAVPDTRLLNTVTLAEESLGMADLVGVLRERTGVDIALADQAARDAIAVYCTDKPLREVLRQMARALDLQWTRAGAGDASHYRAVLREAPTPEAEEAAEPPAMMLSGAAAAPGPAVGRSAKGETADAQARRTGGAPRPEPDVSIIGDPERVRAVLGHARGGRVAPGAAPLQTEGWLILRRER